MKLFKICLSLVILLTFLASCSTLDVDLSDTSTQKVDLDIEKIEFHGLTVIMIKSPIYENDDAMAAYASELLADAGWDVEFKIYDFDLSDYENSSSAYQAFIMNELDSGKDLVFENWGMLNHEEFKANRYLAKKVGGGYNYLRNLGHSKEYSFQGIYIRKELDELYGEEINSIEDYDRFLAWAKINNPDDKPCLMVMQSTLHDHFNPISLFAQMSGYTKVDHAISGLHDNGSTIYMSDIDMYNYQYDTPDVYEAIELPFFIEMDNYLSKWYKNGLLEFTSYDEFESTSGYSSIVCNIKDSTNYYSRDYTDSRLQLLDVSDFNLHVLSNNENFHYSPSIYEHTRNSTFLFASENPSTSLGESFLDWIYSYNDNYLLFMFGMEDIDYKVVNGQLEFLTNPNGLSYGEWEIHKNFIDDRMNPVMPHFPSNWAEVQQKFSQTKGFRIRGSTIITTKDGYILGSNETVVEMNSLSSFDSGIYSLYEKYFLDIGKKEDRYTLWDLRVDIEKSVSAQKRKENYTEILIFVSGIK